MNGLRVYTKPKDSGLSGEARVYFSRRGNGPFYRWLYEEIGGRWHVSRVIAPDFSAQLLSVASWKAVPVSLQTKLGEHYFE